MNHELDNIFEKEDYRYKLYTLFQKFDSGEITLETLAKELSEQYQDIYEGAVVKNIKLKDCKNPFITLWDNALQHMSSSEYEEAIGRIRVSWSDFMDYFFSMWYLRRAEEIINKTSEPL